MNPLPAKKGAPTFADRLARLLAVLNEVLKSDLPDNVRRAIMEAVVLIEALGKATGPETTGKAALDVVNRSVFDLHRAGLLQEATERILAELGRGEGRRDHRVFAALEGALERTKGRR